MASRSGSVRQRARLLRSEEHTSELQSQSNLVCRLLLEKKNGQFTTIRLIGRLGSECLQELKRQIGPGGPQLILDLAEEVLVDVEAVPFLTACQTQSAKVTKRFSEGQIVAFFPAKVAWSDYMVVRYNSLLAVPKEISDQIAAQMLINTITASVLIKFFFF